MEKERGMEAPTLHEIEATRAREMRLVDGRLVELRTPVSVSS